MTHRNLTLEERKLGPIISESFNLKLDHIQEYVFNENINGFLIKKGKHPILKLEILFPAGRTFESKKVVAKACASLMKDGTKNYTSHQIAEKFDYYGASLHVPEQTDHISVIFYSLKPYFSALIPIVKEILRLATFPEEELNIYKKNQIEKLALDTSKNEIVAYREFTSLLYGQDHPYGYNTSKDLIEALERQDLVDHYQRHFISNGAKVILSGDIDDEIISIVSGLLADIPPNSSMATPYLFPEKFENHAGEIFQIKGKQKNQAAIKLGGRTIQRNHTDFPGLYILNTILGGYFGSRLNLNLREDKGYTYGVYSSLDAHKYSAYFMTSVECSPKNVQKCLGLISDEIKKLQDEPIPIPELQMVKNYLNGYLLAAMDGPLNTSDLVKSIVADDLPLTFFDTLVNKIQTIEAGELQSLAQNYLKMEYWTTVIVS